MQYKKSQFIRDLKDKETIASPFLIKFSTSAVGKTGKPYMNLVLTDRSGDLDARLFDDVSQHLGQATPGAFAWVEGRCQLYQGRKQIVVQKLQILREDEIEPKDFVTESRLDPEALYAKLLGYVATMQDPHYRALAEAILRDDAEIVDRIKRAPAAKSIHHAYKTGLLEHVVSITGILDALAAHYGKLLDRDLLFLGGFFHDIGKIWELTYDRVTEYSDEGRLIGHLVMGTELVTKKAGGIEGFPTEKLLLVKHMILAHHGKLEYGSPKEPHVLEALLVHMIDDLDSKVNAISQFAIQDQNPGRWTALNRQFGRYFFKTDGLLESESAQK